MTNDTSVQYCRLNARANEMYIGVHTLAVQNSVFSPCRSRATATWLRNKFISCRTNGCALNIYASLGLIYICVDECNQEQYEVQKIDIKKLKHRNC